MIRTGHVAQAVSVSIRKRVNKPFQPGLFTRFLAVVI